MKGNMMGATGRFTITTAMHTALPRGSDTNHLTFGLKTPGRRACYRSLRLSDRHEAEFRLVPGGMAVYDDYGWDTTPGIARYVDSQLQLKDRTVLHNLNGHAIVIKR